MSIERKLKNRINRLFLQWKGIGKLMYLPFFVTYILLPLSVYAFGRISEEYDPESYFQELSLLFIPIMSVWWSVMILQEYVEGNGHELLWLHERGKVLDVLIYFILYFVTAYPIIAYSMNIWGIELDFYLFLFSQSFFYLGVVYVLSFLAKSVVVAFIPIFAYNLYANDRISVILESLNATGIQSTGSYFMAGIICFILGITYHRRLG